MWLPAFIAISMCAYASCVAQKDPSKGKRPPNIVLFMVDDLGIGDVGCFGNTTLKTPNIDRIASEGVKMTHSLAAASVCTPSRAAFLTGRYPIRMGMVPTNIMRVHLFVSNTGGLPPNETTIAELAKKQGYETAIIGKWHLGLNCESRGDFCHHPLKQGFDYFYGMVLTNLKDFGNEGFNVVQSRLPHINLVLLSIALGGVLAGVFLVKIGVVGRCGLCTITIPTMLLPFLFYLAYTNKAVFDSVVMRNYDVVEQPIQLYDNFTHRLLKEGVDFIAQRRQDDKPFLLVMSWLQVHTSLHCTKEFQGRSKHGKYGDEVMEMDWSVGQVLDALAKFGMEEDTFVYLTSDNGGHPEEKDKDGIVEGGWNGIYKGGKTQGGMEGGIRVPTVARWPGKITPGHVVNQAVSLMDVFPTVAGIIGAELPKDRRIDGRDILPLLTGKSKAAPHEFLFHYCGPHIHSARYSPTDGHDIWKVHFVTPSCIVDNTPCPFVSDCTGSALVYHDPPLLYNIAKDPSEDSPLDVAEPKNLAIVDKLRSAVRKHVSQIEMTPNQFSVPNLLPRPWLQPCCNFPYCSCKDKVYALKP